MGKLVFIGNIVATLYLAGLIWTIQVVHYPLFAKVGSAGWLDYHSAHNAAITAIVALPMLVELGLSFALLAARPDKLPLWIAYVGFGLALLVWISTAALSVPIHGQLSAGLDIAAVERLVATNWVRTLAWTAHSALLAYGLLLVID
jgi:hypothetical protein